MVVTYTRIFFYSRDLHSARLYDTGRVIERKKMLKHQFVAFGSTKEAKSVGRNDNGGDEQAEDDKMEVDVESSSAKPDSGKKK